MRKKSGSLSWSQAALNGGFSGHGCSRIIPDQKKRQVYLPVFEYYKILEIRGTGVMGEDKEKLRAIIRELGEAISNTLVESDSVQIILKRIKEQGYNIDLSLAIGVGLYRDRQKGILNTSLTTHEGTHEDMSDELRFEINQKDLEFLNSLHIRIDREGN
jgi:hypothetical protein